MAINKLKEHIFSNINTGAQTKNLHSNSMNI